MSNPKFNLRDKVKYTISSEVNGMKISQTFEFFIMGVKIAPSAHGQVFEYTLAEQLPGAYYSGKNFFQNIAEKDLS